MLLSDVNDELVAMLCSELGANPLSKETAGKIDVLITMLPNSDIVEEVILGQGWADQLPEGATIIDMSSSVPTRSRALAAALSEKGLKYLDAPVSGGVKKAEAGELAILVGGTSNLLERWRAILGTIGGTILHIGEAGTGHAAKALNNYVSACGLMATVEALHIAKRFGITPEAMTGVLNASSGRTNTSENKVTQFMLNDTFASGFSLKLMDKDLGIAAELAENLSYQMQLGQHGIALWHRLAEGVGPDTDHTEMYKLMTQEE